MLYDNKFTRLNVSNCNFYLKPPGEEFENSQLWHTVVLKNACAASTQPENTEMDVLKAMHKLYDSSLIQFHYYTIKN